MREGERVDGEPAVQRLVLYERGREWMGSQPYRGWCCMREGESGWGASRTEAGAV